MSRTNSGPEETCDECGEDRLPAWVYDTGFTLCAVCLEKKLLAQENALKVAHGIVSETGDVRGLAAIEKALGWS